MLSKKGKMMSKEFDIEQLMQEWEINGFVVFEDFIPLDKIDRIHQVWVPIRNDNIEQQGQSGNRGGYRDNVRVPLKVHVSMKKSLSILHLLNFLNEYWDQIMFGHTLTQTFLCLTQTISTGTVTVNLLFPKLMPPTFQVGVKFPLGWHP